MHFGHALKNTLVPVITITGLQLGAIIAFAIITETVFQWPGMDSLFIQAVSFADVPVMAYLCLIALFFVIINLVVDLLTMRSTHACASDQYDDAYRAHPRLPPRTDRDPARPARASGAFLTEQRTSGVRRNTCTSLARKPTWTSRRPASWA